MPDQRLLQKYTHRENLHEQDNGSNQKFISNELVEYLLYEEISNNHDKKFFFNMNINNEINDSPMLAHIAKRSLPIK